MLSYGKISLQRCAIVNSFIRQKSFGTLAVISPEGSGVENSGQKKKKQSSKHRKQRGASGYKFVDSAKIRVNAGNGAKDVYPTKQNLDQVLRRGLMAVMGGTAEM
jgi:hypothetical protein